MCNDAQYGNMADDDHDDLDEDETGQIFIQPELEVYKQEKDSKVSFGRPRVNNRMLLLEKYFPLRQ